MMFGVRARRTAVFAAFPAVLFAAIAAYAWRISVYSAPRPLPSWSGTISSAAPSSTEKTVAPPRVIVEYGRADLEAAFNRYWRENINALREEKGLRALRTDERLVATAKAWADEMAARGEVTHERLDGKTMHQWIDTKELPFSERGSEDGWHTNYFVENIARFYAEPTLEDMKRALDETLARFLAEGPGGDHYESIYHPDWNRVGTGFSFEESEGPSRAYFVFHYGSLK